ncbi:MAG: MBOAT family protein [Bacteroidales bacterium]|nr:MAG: MBOAT family protein [Bacteroidales bacterium]
MIDYTIQMLYQVFSYTEGDPLLFTKISFWIFFAVLLIGYSFVYDKPVVRSAYLLAFSLFFYYKSSGLFFSLLIFSTLCDYIIGLLIPRASSKLKRKLLVSLSVLINLGVLSYFKYAYFYTDIVNSLFGTDLKVVNHISVWVNSISGSNFDTTSILLPVGISFYTFQTISYTVDVYRNKIPPVKNIIDFAFYVSFFPQLVAGPIVRAAEFIPQLYRKFSLTNREFGHAVFLIIAGLIKKMIISDYISINFVDRVFDSPLSYSGFENLMAVYGYALQIYCDFSGYTDMAIGLAMLLGFRLPINFNSPYKATSISDFWHRWHISLSTWLRDYLYISIGGNRKGAFRTYLNLLVTMILGGLWHGASLRFVVWGAIHGVGLALNKLWSSYFSGFNLSSKTLRNFIGGFLTFQVVSFSWIFFRSESMSDAWKMLNQIVYRFGTSSVVEVVQSYSTVFALILIGFVMHWLPFRTKEWCRGKFIDLNILLKIVVIVIAVIVILQFKTAEIQPFIYFRF